ncbi:hypothetical protein PcaKH15_04030 [Parageobacillus caldoxylosilyticus]|uniref:Uncharacterized protein n=1 Tax=Parageobacillus caldoxylosilyticus NBRC 107762 TaxID=1220594 RepID=A0A023DHY0_9BACL|nr:hypothetical protein PcaKH15_04030 [Parageobacillus caldoxylosilyticus]BDG38269.1 hypothetical protein PcaKH16_04080 [Parageobacillus caldoxylosilyticus]BDG42059.1 hypothetical protein PcaKH35_04040 [Parageobacillus caldoxylosilyticus]GAJ40885.1 hypothetical protein GCA01S_053_00170 [Parageobacillus caldoxylosilyticus NBRC 107762]
MDGRASFYLAINVMIYRELKNILNKDDKFFSIRINTIFLKENNGENSGERSR